MTLDEALAGVPIVAIIRGVTPEEAPAIGEALHRGGIRVVEVPLNSPRPLDSIAALAAGFAGRLVVGAGTVLAPDQVGAVEAVGGRIIVSPNTEPGVIRRAVELGLEPMPGFTTPTEAFTALAAGARRLKLFPASSLGGGHLKALKAVLPPEAMVLAVGGAGPDSMADWWAAGARGFGLGGELYRPGQSPEETFERAVRAVAAARRLIG